jgi:GNAT superfamily N-acetyltransferase
VISIRTIRPGEGAALLAMTRALATSHGEEDHFTATPELVEAALFAENPIVHCLIAEYGGTPAGCAVWHRSFSSFRGREVMYLEDVSVLPEFRRKGIARALMKSVAKTAVERGYPGIAWLVMDWNDGARKLYEEAGAELQGGTVFCRIAGEALERLAAEP